MKRTRKLDRILTTSLIALTMLSQPAIMASAAVQPVSTTQNVMNPFVQVKGLDFEARSKQYEAMKLSPAGWQVGMVLSKEPYAVVTRVDAQSADVRIWTGVLARSGSNLGVFWDEIRIDNGGVLVYRDTDELETIKGYFESPSQETYRTKTYLGKVPWAFIPTDAEAALNGSSVVSSEGTLNVYGIVYKDPNVTQAPSLGPVKQEKEIPNVVPTLKKFKENASATLPTDAVSHWAKDEILDLMKKSIIEGYEDHTIRPDRTLSKAEFITLLVKSIGIDPVQAGVSGYTDLEGHWSGPYVAASQAFGLLDRNPSQLRFAPDAAMSRIEMADLVSRILSKYQVKLKSESLSFIDITGLTETNRSSLQAVVNAGIVGGYEDGSFRPQGSLTRAEAFKVVSKLLQLL